MQIFSSLIQPKTATDAPVTVCSSDSVLFVCLLFNFFFLLFTTVLSQWDFSHGKFGLPFMWKTSGDRVALPNLGCMLGVIVFL